MTTNNTTVPCSPYQTFHGLVYFPRMLEKIRLQHAGKLREDLHANLGKGFDAHCIQFLKVSYLELVRQVTAGKSDEEILEWCFREGRQPDAELIEVWNSFMKKYGWHDETSEVLAQRKAESGFGDREDIQTFFDYIDYDEGRVPEVSGTSGVEA